jgi:quercetin dioxygenase-like cupin family protein
MPAPATTLELVPPAEESELTLALLRLETGGAHVLDEAARDTLLYVASGSGSLQVGAERTPLEVGTAALVVADERATVSATGPLETLRIAIDAGADRHAPLGPRERVVRLAEAGSQAATGARSFQVLFGPANGSTRATLFAGSIPPGKAPWHYHLYDEIVWVPEGPARVHRQAGGSEELGPGSAFRLRPREVHIVENPSPDRELTILGVFTPAGSPSAAYLHPDVAAGYVFAG